MKSIVTGGAGFIGSHVVDELIKAGHDVTVLDDLSGGFKSNISAKALLVEGSVLNEKLIDQLFRLNRFDYVYHLAAYAAEGLSHFIRNFNYRNNVVGSVNMINAAVKYESKCFVFTSSAAVYGHCDGENSEQDAPHPVDPYGIAKYAVELDLEAARHMFGLPYVIFRPHNVYGERQNIGDKYRNVVGIFMNKILRGEVLPIFGDGTQSRVFSHISDIAPLIASAPMNEKALNRKINLGSDVSYTVNELASLVSRAMGVDTRVDYQPERPEVKHVLLKHDLMKEIFGPQQHLTLPAGLTRMVQWVRKHGSRQTSSFGTLELERGLPPSWR